MLRGIEKRDIFLTENDYKKFLHYVELIKEKSEISLLAYCLMTNHVHMLLKEENEEVGYRFNAPVRVPGKSFRVTGRIIVIKCIERQERVKIVDIRFADDSGQFNSGSVNFIFTPNDLFHLSQYLLSLLCF